jgi:MFS family permease
MPFAQRIGLSLPAHHRVFAAFFVYAFGFGGFFPRLAELQHSMGVSEGALGLGLIGTAVGTLIALSFAGRLVERVGHRTVLLWVPLLVPAIYAVASFAQGTLQLFLTLLPAGLLIGMIEVVVNLEADRVEHHIGKRIMNRAHAFWSLGFFGAGLLGALAARLGISPQVQLVGMVPLAAALTWCLLGRFEAAPHRAGSNDEPTPHVAKPTGPILALVAVSLSALVMEGAGFDWSAIYMREVFETAPFVGGLAVAVGAFSQGTARYVADGFVERHSPVAVARVLLCVLGVGTALVCFAPHPYLALTGFACMGVGTSVLFPLAMSAAAQRTDRPAAVNVAALAQFGFVAFLLAPPSLGWVAEHWGLRLAFGVGLPLVLVSLLATPVLKSAPPRAH